MLISVVTSIFFTASLMAFCNVLALRSVIFI